MSAFNNFASVNTHSRVDCNFTYLCLHKMTVEAVILTKVTVPENTKQTEYIDMIKRGELYYADLSPVVGSEQGGIRPVLVVQNDVGNKYSPTVIAAAITSQMNKAKLPTHIEISADEFGLNKDSVVLLEQIRTIDKKRLKDRIGELDDDLMNKINQALLVSLGFIPPGA